MIGSADEDWLRERWLDLVTPYTSDSFGVHATWHALYACYSDPRRSYHNLEHVAALLRLADQERAQICEPEVVEFAIWFHDAIYDTHARDNEQKSAAWAREALEAISVDPRYVDAVEACILATQNHALGAAAIADLPLFLDLDLAILGAEDADYDDYSRRVREEYAWVPQAQYREGRLAVLRRFAERDRLFLTPSMIARFEARA
ncbi:MAG TPA: hypothetical protein VM406_02660, partial [Noviherbaspirillum sp.]|nr:hypothetical protein [Noviherbaspirillum sp.]